VLYRLSKKGQDGCTVLRGILGASTCFEEVVLPFIIWLGQDLLSKGSFAHVQQAVLEDMWRTPGLAEEMMQAVQEQRLADELPIAWFLERLCCAQGPAAESARSDLDIIALADELMLRNSTSAVRVQAERIWTAVHPGETYLEPQEEQNDDEQQQQLASSGTAFAGTGSSRSLAAARSDAPGGRHDNDFVDYRSIEIVPTAAELNCPREPFLPTPREQWPALDAHFRRLRHDLVSSVQEKLRESTAEPRQGGRPPPLRLLNAARADAYANPEKIALSCMLFHFDLPAQHYAARLNRTERRKWWEDKGGRNLLKYETLVAFVPRSSSSSSASSSSTNAEQPLPLLLGEVQWRDLDAVTGITLQEAKQDAERAARRAAEEQQQQQQSQQQQPRQQQASGPAAHSNGFQGRGRGGFAGRGSPGGSGRGSLGDRAVARHSAPAQVTRPVIGIRFFTKEDTETALSWQYGAAVADLVPLNVSVFAYRPVLLRLQAMSAIPLSAQIVKWTAPASTTNTNSSSSSSSSSGSNSGSSSSTNNSSSSDTNSNRNSSSSSGSSGSSSSSSSSSTAVAAVPRPVYDTESSNASVQALLDIFEPTAAEELAQAQFIVPVLPGLQLTAPLDYSQRVAVASALSQAVSIVQGPPGTGKTHIGCILAQVRALHRDTW
jgi:hypothetical protein